MNMPPMPAAATLIMGPTGAGKTPLGDYATAQSSPQQPVRHFDFGAQLRLIAATRAQQSISPQASTIIREALASGRLLQPKEFFVAREILTAFLTETPPGTLLLLNGLPRSVDQARAMAATVRIQHLIVLEATAEIILQRIRTNQGGDRTGRTDDTPGAIQNRLARYQQQTQPLLAYFSRQATAICRVPIQVDTTPAHIWNQYQAQIGM